MKKKICLILAGIVTAASLFTACGAGKAQNTAKEEQAAAAEETAEEVTEEMTEEVTAEAPSAGASAGTAEAPPGTPDPQAGASAAAAEAAVSSTAAAADAVEEAGTGLETYTDAKGWSVKYDPEKITLNKLEDGAGFVYTGDSAGTNMITIRCIPDKQPEELLYEVTGEWGADDSIQDSITRGEGYLPGTTDKWGFWRMLNTGAEGSAMSRAAMAGEYNGEVLLFDITAHMTGGNSVDLAVNDEMAAFVDSMTYENFEPQTMYDYVPGTYVQEAPEQADAGSGDAIESTHIITLRPDHTGTLSFQDTVEITWGSTRLTDVNKSFEYEYTIEGDSLMLNMDGDWLTFQKQEADAAQ